MRVLGIDPGYGRCGVAIVEKDTGKEVLIYSDCIETPARDESAKRIAAVAAECARLMDSYEPEAVALEKLFFTKNQKTAMRVAEVRGALIAATMERDIPLFEYTPGQVKAAAAGWGGADKTQVAKMLHTLVRIEKKITHDDEYDAIAIAVTHLACARTPVASQAQTR